MDLGLRDKVALVAGGSSGIGLATARELAAEGARVAICGRDPDRLATARAELARVGGDRISASQLDITDEAAAADWVRRTGAEWGGPHVLVVSGGSPPFGTAGRFTLAGYRAAVDQVLLPAVNLALAALPLLRAAGWGRVLFIASETASVPIAPLALSGVTRAALVRFAQGLAAEVGRDGITVNVVAPGHVLTPPMRRVATRLAAPAGEPATAMRSGGLSVGEPAARRASEPSTAEIEAQLTAMGAHSAVGRLARAEEIAALVVFLASDRASFITGGVHLADGGAAVLGPDLPHLRGVPTDPNH